VRVSDHPELDPDAALELIKAILKTGGRPLTNAEKIEFMETDHLLFNGHEMVDREPPKPPPKRGPKPNPTEKVTRYQRRAERMKGDYHRLIRLPRSGGQAREGDTQVPALVAKVAKGLPLADMPENKRVAAVRRALELDKTPCDDKAIRDALRALGFYGRKTPPD
jgi:hypothetical protein